MRADPPSRQSGFGKRGHVHVSNPPPHSPAEPASSPSSIGYLMKWAGGGIAAVCILGLIAGGTGGGGLLGGILGGLIGSQLAKRTAAPAVAPGTQTASQAARAMTPTTTVQRGGFGTTGASSTSGFGSSAGS